MTGDQRIILAWAGAQPKFTKLRIALDLWIFSNPPDRLPEGAHVHIATLSPILWGEWTLRVGFRLPATGELSWTAAVWGGEIEELTYQSEVNQIVFDALAGVLAEMTTDRRPHLPYDLWEGL